MVDALELQAQWLRQLLGVEAPPPSSAASEGHLDSYALDYAAAYGSEDDESAYWSAAEAIKPELAVELQGGAMMPLEPEPQPEPEPEPEVDAAGLNLGPSELGTEDVDVDVEGDGEDLDTPMRPDVAYLQEEDVMGMAENEQLAAAIAMSLQQVSSHRSCRCL